MSEVECGLTVTQNYQTGNLRTYWSARFAKLWMDGIKVARELARWFLDYLPFPRTHVADVLHNSNRGPFRSYHNNKKKKRKKKKCYYVHYKPNEWNVLSTVTKKENPQTPKHDTRCRKYFLSKSSGTKIRNFVVFSCLEFFFVCDTLPTLFFFRLGHSIVDFEPSPIPLTFLLVYSIEPSSHYKTACALKDRKSIIIHPPLVISV